MVDQPEKIILLTFNAVVLMLMHVGSMTCRLCQ